MNLVMAARHESASKLDTILTCTALVVKHLNSQHHCFIGFLKTFTSVVEVRAELVGGGGWMTPCIKIGYSSRELRRVILPCFKIGYVSAMY